MTQNLPDAANGPGGALANYNFDSTGLEDFDSSDAVMPRIKIEHQTGVWKDTLSGQEFTTLRFIALGLIKQRVLFHHNVEDDDVPMCKSSDFHTGYPNPEAPQKKSFPWQLSGFNPADFPVDAEGNQPLPCAGCALKDWGSNPTSDAPYCAEQWTLPIYYDQSPDGSGEWAPAILTLQKSSIKPIRTYLTSFKQSNKPPFLAVGHGTLRVMQRGSVTYSVPSFVKAEESPRERWQEFSQQFADMRQFLTRPPIRELEVVSVTNGQNNQYAGPSQPQRVQSEVVYQQPAQAQPAPQQAAPQQASPWDDQSVQQAAPQQPAPPQAPPVQEAPAPAADPQVAAPPQQPAPQQPAPPQQAVTPPAQPAAPPASAADDDLPFCRSSHLGGSRLRLGAPAFTPPRMV